MLLNISCLIATFNFCHVRPMSTSKFNFIACASHFRNLNLNGVFRQYNAVHIIIVIPVKTPPILHKVDSIRNVLQYLDDLGKN